MGRTGTWFAAEQLPIVPDVITTAKGLGAGYAPIGAVLCRDEVYRAIAEGSRAFELGHTWDGAPLPCAVGLAVIRYMRDHELVERVRDEGPRLLAALQDALADCELVAEVRGRGFLLGIDYADPRDGRSFLPPELGSRGGSTSRPSPAASSSTRRSRRATATRATRRSSLPPSRPPTRSSRSSSSEWPRRCEPSSGRRSWSSRATRAVGRAR